MITFDKKILVKDLELGLSALAKLEDIMINY